MESSSSGSESAANGYRKGNCRDSDDDNEAEHHPSHPEPKRRARGRPKGSFGNAVLRSLHQDIRQGEIAQQPLPGSVEYARQQKKKRKQKEADITQTPGEQSVQPFGAGILAASSSFWSLVQDTGTMLQSILGTCAQCSFQNQDMKMRTDSQDAAVFAAKKAAVMSDQALHVLMEKDGHPGHRSRLSEKLLRGSAASILGGGLLWGGFVQAVCHKIEAGIWHGSLCVLKFRYDETPLKVRTLLDSAASISTC